MKNIVIFGYGYTGTKAARQVKDAPEYNLIGFADNSEYKQGYYSYGHIIMSFEDLIELSQEIDLSVIIASEKAYNEIIEDCKSNEISIEGVFLDNRIKKYPWVSFDSLDLKQDIILYAGDIEDSLHYEIKNLYGLSITQHDDRHIAHDVTKKYPLPDNCIASYESECVFEMIGEKNVLPALKEIHRILRPEGWLRLTLPDYYSPFLKNRSMTDKEGRIIYDAGETFAIKYGKEGTIGGEIWYSNYDLLKEKLDEVGFNRIDWLCFHDVNERLHKKYIDMTKGYVHRVNNESDKDVYCIVVDCYK